MLWGRGAQMREEVYRREEEERKGRENWENRKGKAARRFYL